MKNLWILGALILSLAEVNEWFIVPGYSKVICWTMGIAGPIAIGVLEGIGKGVAKGLRGMD